MFIRALPLMTCDNGKKFSGLPLLLWQNYNIMTGSTHFYFQGCTVAHDVQVQLYPILSVSYFNWQAVSKEDLSNQSSLYRNYQSLKVIWCKKG